MKNKTLILFFTLIVMFALSACTKHDAQSDTETTDILYGSEITTLTIEENDLLVYYPTPNSAETLGISTSCTAPVFIVFGEEAYTSDTAVAYANESGLAELAAENGSIVCFVNPVDASWSAKDDEAYTNIAGIINDSSTESPLNGVITGVDYSSGEQTTTISGTQQRIYVYAIGKGADYVASSLLKTLEVETSWGGTNNITLSGCTLENLSGIPNIEQNDINVVSVGNSDEINQVLIENCREAVQQDSADYISGFSTLIGQYRRQYGSLIAITDYEQEGIVENIESVTVTTSEDNTSEAFAGTEEHEINYITYYAEDLDIQSKEVPLVLCFHGGGNTALYQVWASEWPLIGKENGFITVSVDLHTNCSATEIISLIDHLQEEYSIDKSRIYASGFSMGGCKSWDLLEQYPEVFAGVAPMSATYEIGIDSFGNEAAEINTGTIIPTFYIGGEVSPLEELPSQGEKLIDRFDQVFDINNVITSYNVKFEDKEEWENPYYGICGDIVYTIADDKDFTDSILTVNLFQSEDQVYYTALANSSNQSHEVYARNSWAAWDFLSQYSRNEDGTISVSEVTYKMEDDSVKDNSYNFAE